jgi:hypothetical protein
MATSLPVAEPANIGVVWKRDAVGLATFRRPATDQTLRPLRDPDAVDE